jgi:hypothetical protein
MVLNSTLRRLKFDFPKELFWNNWNTFHSMFNLAFGFDWLWLSTTSAAGDADRDEELDGDDKEAS